MTGWLPTLDFTAMALGIALVASLPRAVLSYWRKGNVDIKSTLLLAGAGAAIPISGRIMTAAFLNDFEMIRSDWRLYLFFAALATAGLSLEAVAKDYWPRRSREPVTDSATDQGGTALPAATATGESASPSEPAKSSDRIKS